MPSMSRRASRHRLSASEVGLAEQVRESSQATSGPGARPVRRWHRVTWSCCARVRASLRAAWAWYLKEAGQRSVRRSTLRDAAAYLPRGFYRVRHKLAYNRQAHPDRELVRLRASRSAPPLPPDPVVAAHRSPRVAALPIDRCAHHPLHDIQQHPHPRAGRGLGAAHRLPANGERRHRQVIDLITRPRSAPSGTGDVRRRLLWSSHGTEHVPSGIVVPRRGGWRSARGALRARSDAGQHRSR